ncbi:hypothetical protein ABT367_29905, partial [Streptomyces mesophilus]
GGTQFVANDGSNKDNMYGYSADDLKNAKVPWGTPEEESHHWYEVGHWVKSFVWDGLIVDGIWGTIKGLGTLVGFQGLDAMGQAWKGLAQLATGLLIMSVPVVGAAYMMAPDDKLPSWLRDSRTAVKETGKALVAWDEWGKNPARAAGAVTFNVVTTVFTGGAGAGVAGAGKAGAVAKTLGALSKAGKAIDPMTYITKAGGAGLTKLGDVMAGLKGVGTIDIPPLPANAFELPEGAVKLPDGTFDIPAGATIPEGAVKLSDGNFKLPEGTVTVPQGTVKLPTEAGIPAQYMDPKGNILDGQGTVIQHADDAPKPLDSNANPAELPRIETPVREPALVGAVPDTADNAAGAGTHSADGAADDAARTTDDGADQTPAEPGDGSADAATTADDSLPPKSPGDDEPLIIRQDNDFSATHNEFGLRKSRFDPDQGIVPANPEGAITPLEHVLGGSNPVAKQNSQFTSFAPKDGTGKIYGEQEVSIDYRRLEADIASGKVRDVQVLRPEQIQRSIGDEINKVAGKEVAVPATLKGSDTDAVTAFVKDLGLSKGKTDKVYRRVMALLNTRRDGEWLISGVVPKEYVQGPYPTTRQP